MSETMINDTLAVAYFLRPPLVAHPLLAQRAKSLLLARWANNYCAHTPHQTGLDPSSLYVRMSRVFDLYASTSRIKLLKCNFYDYTATIKS